MPHGLPESKNHSEGIIFLVSIFVILTFLLVLLEHKELGVRLTGLLVHQYGD